MDKLLMILNKKPKLYEQTELNIWDDPYISQQMLKAHLDECAGATRNLNFVERSVEWISSLFGESMKLLDLGCGPGIYTELFYNKGYQVTGIDLSQNSIEYAIKVANQKKLDIHYIQGDYTKIDFGCQYNVITLIYCDFGVLPTDVRQALLKKVYHALLPGGTFIFDVFTPLKYKDKKEYKSWDICENGFWNEKQCITFDAFYRYEDDNTFLNQYTVLTKDEELFKYNVWEHTFTSKELNDDLIEAGFKDIRFYGNIVGDICTDNDETICIVAKKSL